MNMIKSIKRKFIKRIIDFYDYQILDQMPGVRLKWGRDFYRSCSKKNEMEEKENG